MTLEVAKLLLTTDEELERQHPGILAVFKREQDCDIKNIQRRLERAVCGRQIRADEEGQREIAELIHKVQVDYVNLIGRMPSIIIQFFFAAENKPYEGALPLRRILLRFEMPTGKGQL